MLAQKRKVARGGGSESIKTFFAFPAAAVIFLICGNLQSLKRGGGETGSHATWDIFFHDSRYVAEWIMCAKLCAFVFLAEIKIKRAGSKKSPLIKRDYLIFRIEFNPRKCFDLPYSYRKKSKFKFRPRLLDMWENRFWRPSKKVQLRSPLWLPAKI